MGKKINFRFFQKRVSAAVFLLTSHIGRGASLHPFPVGSPADPDLSYFVSPKIQKNPRWLTSQ